MEQEMKSLTLRIPEEIHRKLKILASYSSKNMTQIIIDLIEQEFKRSELPDKKP